MTSPSRPPQETTITLLSRWWLAPKVWFVGSALILLNGLLYGNFLRNPLIFDDLALLDNIAESYTSLLSYYVSIGWTWSVAGPNLFWLRLGNLLLHVANAVVLFVFLRTLFDLVLTQPKPTPTLPPVWLAFFGALLFALHPVAVYGVAYLIQRSILMATLFSLLTWVAYLQGLIRGKQSWFMAAAICYFLAVFSKEHSIMVPAVALTLTFLLRRPSVELLKQIAPVILFALIGKILNQVRCPALLLLISIIICGGSRPVLAASSISTHVADAAQLASGRKIYNFRCYFCHGYSGNAQTVAASLLVPPPVDFTSTKARHFTAEHIVTVLQNGKPGTAMQAFNKVLSAMEIQQVAAFVMDEFIRRKAPNTHYHTAENGWPDHQRYQDAFPFATGDIPVSQPWETLSETQARGKRLFLSSCVICHDRGSDNVVWEARPLSYPRNHYIPAAPLAPVLDAMTSASPYLLHDIVPQVVGMTEQEQRGEQLFQSNCAFCHGADGTGKNWIGSFLEPHPRNLRDPLFMAGMTRSRLAATIREGLPNTSMPAWKAVLSAEDIAAVVAYVAKAFHPLQD